MPIIRFLFKLYKTLISPLLGNRCRFYPSCSEYCMSSMELNGIIIGFFQGIIRIIRCNPLVAGGEDPVKPVSFNLKILFTGSGK